LFWYINAGFAGGILGGYAGGKTGKTGAERLFDNWWKDDSQQPQQQPQQSLLGHLGRNLTPQLADLLYAIPGAKAIPGVKPLLSMPVSRAGLQALPGRVASNVRNYPGYVKQTMNNAVESVSSLRGRIMDAISPSTSGKYVVGDSFTNNFFRTASPTDVERLMMRRYARSRQRLMDAGESTENLERYGRDVQDAWNKAYGNDTYGNPVSRSSDAMRQNNMLFRINAPAVHSELKSPNGAINGQSRVGAYDPLTYVKEDIGPRTEITTGNATPIKYYDATDPRVLSTTDMKKQLGKNEAIRGAEQRDGDTVVSDFTEYKGGIRPRIKIPHGEKGDATWVGREPTASADAYGRDGGYFGVYDDSKLNPIAGRMNDDAGKEYFPYTRHLTSSNPDEIRPIALESRRHTVGDSNAAPNSDMLHQYEGVVHNDSLIPALKKEYRVLGRTGEKALTDGYDQQRYYPRHLATQETYDDIVRDGTRSYETGIGRAPMDEYARRINKGA
jgi:hypothetical protein